jgi:hypothetical protein
MTMLLFVLLAVLWAADATAGIVELKKDGFSISIPDDWREIPREVLDDYERGMKKADPKASVPHNDYGFSLKSAEDWFDTPCILLQINKAGRIPESLLKQRFPPDAVQEGLDDLEEFYDNVMKMDANDVKLLYDKEKKILWISMKMNVKDFGETYGLSGMIMTEIGYILATGTALAQEYPQYESVFRSVILSISPEPALAYRPRWWDKLPPFLVSQGVTRILQQLTSLAFFLLVVAFIRRWRRKKRADDIDLLGPL